MPKQGDIYMADLSHTEGHEQAGFRPVLVLQNNILNKNLGTVVIAPLTGNLKARDKMTTYFLPRLTSRLGKDSVLLLFQIRTIDKRRLREKRATLPNSSMHAIKEQLKFVF